MMNQPMMPEQNNSSEHRAMEQSQSRQDSNVPYPSIPNDTALYQNMMPQYQMPMNPMAFRTPVCCPFFPSFPVPYTCEDMLPLGGDWVMPYASMNMMPYGQMNQSSQTPWMSSAMPRTLPKNPDGTPFCNGECMQ